MDAKTKELLKPLKEVYAKAPALPKSATDFLVSIAPWLALIFGVLAILAGVGGLGVFTAFSPLAYMYAGSGLSILLLVSAAIAIVEGVIMVLAFMPLKARKIRGWNLLVWGEGLAILSSIVSLRVGDIVWAIVGAAIAFYILFQIEPNYK
ncbi:MAG: hypothetical protein ABSD69_01390 [Candidatus Levyibacteriota bacterium]|jgi:hypothetical protein